MDKKVTQFLSEIGKKGGSVKSEAKAEAARRNGLKNSPVYKEMIQEEVTERLGRDGLPLLLEMARIGDKGQYSFWVYSEPLMNPSFHLKHKTDFEIVLQIKDLKILEIKHNQSRFQFVKNKQPPKEILTLIHEFFSEKNSKDPTRSNQDVMDFAWKLLND